MNKYFAYCALILQTIFCAQANQVATFEKLTPEIYKQATTWSEKVVTTLNKNSQLIYLNLLAFSAEGAIEEFIKCNEYIESQASMHDSYKDLGLTIMEIITKYADNIQRKIELKKNITEKQKNQLWEKLEIKVQELMAYINSIYYQSLYGLVAQNNTSPVYMFDENGLLPEEKRTELLPKSL